MLATTCGMMPPSPLPQVPVPSILSMQPVTLPVDQANPYQHFIPKDTVDELTNPQNQT